MLPHDQYPWISPLGVVQPGEHEVVSPLIVPSGYVLHGSVRSRSTIFSRDTQYDVVGLRGMMQNLDVRGGRISVNVRNDAVGARISDCRISNPGLVGLWVGRNIGTRVARCVVTDAPDNGVQLEGPTDCEMHSCAVVGHFGNKAIDSSHGVPSNVRLVHLTVIARNGYGVGLAGWMPGEGNVMLNCAVFSPAPGAGANGYSVLIPNGVSSGEFKRNLLMGRIGGTAEVPTVDQFDQSGVLMEDLPSWALAWLLNPGTKARMWRASLRTMFSTDLEGRTRIPWRGALAIGALAIGAVSRS